MTLVAALSGIAAAVGILLIATGLRPVAVTGKAAAPTQDRRRGMLARISPQARLRALVALAVGLILAAVTGWVLAVIVLPLAAAGLPALLSAPSAGEKIRRLDAMQDWTRSLTGTLDAGLGLEAAIKHSARSAPVAIRGEVQTLVRRINSQARVEDALRAFADDLNDSTGDRLVVNLIQANRMQGVPLGDVLADLADDIAHDVAGRREVESDRARPRSQARIIIVMFILLMIGFFLSSYAAPLRTPLGQGVFFIELILFTATLILQRKMATVPDSARFLDVTHLPEGAIR